MARAVLSRGARQELLRLEWLVADAVGEAINLLERDPEVGYRLRGRLSGIRSFAVGSYRILHVIEDDGRTVRVLAIRHRSATYGVDPR